MSAQIDVIIPTSKDRVRGCISQVKAALWQDVDTRVTVSTAGEFAALKDALSQRELERVRFVEDAPQGCAGHPSVAHCLEGDAGIDDWADWIYVCGDDDILLPWGLKHLWDYRHGAAMVIGQAMTVHKVNHAPTPTLLGHTVTRGQITGSCVLFNFRELEQLPRPWWPRDSYAGDWFVISKLMHLRYKIIPHCVYLLSI